MGLLKEKQTAEVSLLVGGRVRLLAQCSLHLTMVFLAADWLGVNVLVAFTFLPEKPHLQNT